MLCLHLGLLRANSFNPEIAYVKVSIFIINLQILKNSEITAKSNSLSHTSCACSGPGSYLQTSALPEVEVSQRLM